MVAQRATVALALLQVGCSDFSVDDADSTGPYSVAVEETFLQAPRQQVDVLWLIDNTPSMGTEHAQTFRVVQTVIQTLEDRDTSWHLGVITPDGQGVLEGEPWVLTSATYTADALAGTLDVGTEGAVPQHGLASIVAALSDPRLQEENRGFRRPGASLHVVVFSDGDDESDAVLGDDPVAAAASVLEAASVDAPEPARLSAIVGPESEPCIDLDGNAIPAPRYRSLARQTDGAVTSICSPDTQAIALEVSNLSAHLARSFSLQTDPVVGSTRVAIDGERQDTGWALSGNALTFDTPPDLGSTVSVRYRVSR